MIHENFNKCVHFNDIALIKVRIFNRWANMQYIHVIDLSSIWRYYRDKLVIFIILVAKESRRVRRKVASYRTPREGEWTNSGWNTLCCDWLETGKYQVTPATLIYFQIVTNIYTRENRRFVIWQSFQVLRNLEECITDCFFTVKFWTLCFKSVGIHCTHTYIYI